MPTMFYKQIETTVSKKRIKIMHKHVQSKTVKGARVRRQHVVIFELSTSAHCIFVPR